MLDLPVEDAVGFFGEGKAQTPAAHAILQRMADVGLGYLRLGQPLTTLSGGERQRLKLATHMGADGGVYVLDEPTTGLHLADLEQLLGLLDRLVDSGKSVIVIEHHQSVMAHADWIIDLGPGAGHDGGRIVFEGTPADLVAARSTLTGEHLAAFVRLQAVAPLVVRACDRRAQRRHFSRAAFSRTLARTIFLTSAAGSGCSGEKWIVAPLTLWVFEISPFIAAASFGLAVRNERCFGCATNPNRSRPRENMTAVPYEIRSSTFGTVSLINARSFCSVSRSRLVNVAR